MNKGVPRMSRGTPVSKEKRGNMLFFGVKKNQTLETLIAKVRMNQSNNYKDAAQENFRDLQEAYEELLSSGKLNEKQKAHYSEIIGILRGELDKFTHKDQNARWMGGGVG